LFILDNRNIYDPFDPERYGDTYIFTNIDQNKDNLSEGWSKFVCSDINENNDNNDIYNNTSNIDKINDQEGKQFINSNNPIIPTLESMGLLLK